MSPRAAPAGRRVARRLPRRAKRTRDPEQKRARLMAVARTLFARARLRLDHDRRHRATRGRVGGNRLPSLRLEGRAARRRRRRLRARPRPRRCSPPRRRPAQPPSAEAMLRAAFDYVREHGALARLLKLTHDPSGKHDARQASRAQIVAALARGLAIWSAAGQLRPLDPAGHGRAPVRARRGGADRVLRPRRRRGASRTTCAKPCAASRAPCARFRQARALPRRGAPDDEDRFPTLPSCVETTRPGRSRARSPISSCDGELPRELDGTLWRNGPNPQFPPRGSLPLVRRRRHDPCLSLRGRPRLVPQPLGAHGALPARARGRRGALRRARRPGRERSARRAGDDLAERGEHQHRLARGTAARALGGRPAARARPAHARDARAPRLRGAARRRDDRAPQARSRERGDALLRLRLGAALPPLPRGGRRGSPGAERGDRRAGADHDARLPGHEAARDLPGLPGHVPAREHREDRLADRLGARARHADRRHAARRREPRRALVPGGRVLRLPCPERARGRRAHPRRRVSLRAAAAVRVGRAVEGQERAVGAAHALDARSRRRLAEGGAARRSGERVPALRRTARGPSLPPRLRGARSCPEPSRSPASTRSCTGTSRRAGAASTGFPPATRPASRSSCRAAPTRPRATASCSRWSTAAQSAAATCSCSTRRTSMAAPLAVVELPHRIPFGFHGNWGAGV